MTKLSRQPAPRPRKTVTLAEVRKTARLVIPKGEGWVGVREDESDPGMWIGDVICYATGRTVHVCGMSKRETLAMLQGGLAALLAAGGGK